jgi:putative transposase
MASREKQGREASPTAGVIGGQSVKTTEASGPRGYDAGKKINGRKRHILTDTAGHLLALIVHAANIQDRDGAVPVLASIRHRLPWLRHVLADGGYAGEKLRNALAGHGDWTVEIVKRSDTAKEFEVIPKRWGMESTLAYRHPLRQDRPTSSPPSTSSPTSFGSIDDRPCTPQPHLLACHSICTGTM